MVDPIEKERLSLKARVDLEWDKILDCLAGQAVSIPGAKLCRELRLYCEINDVGHRLEETGEMVNLLTEGGGLPLSPFPDLEPILDSAQKGLILETRNLKEIADFLGVALDTKRDIGRHKGIPLLKGIAAGLEDLGGVKKAIDSAIDNDGNIKEDATPRLKSLIRRSQGFKMRIRERLKAIIHSPEYAGILQEPFFAERENRYVLPVRVEFKSKVEGIVHDLSASGATVFIEPKELVEMNNRLKMLEVEIEDEVGKILKSLSQAVASHHQTISHNLSIMAGLDSICARARLSRMMGGRGVRLNNRGFINLKAACHPILSLSGMEVVPNDILIPKDTTTLIISGPNAGGKTVLLKTIGLFALMVRGGLHLSCGDDSEMAIFQEIYTDIGDDQDIGMGLSSFSAHIKAIVSILKFGGVGALILLDEIAGSTDPSEGAAFAQALLLGIRERGFKVIVTTHYGPLKTLGHTEYGFSNASVELDLKTLSPTFKLIFGIPGRSYAINIAGRLGIEKVILEAASKLLGRQDLSLDQVLADLSEKRRNYEEDSKRARELKLEAERLIHEQTVITDRLKEAERDIRKRIKAGVNLEISKARQEISKILEDIKRERHIEKANEAKKLLSEMEMEIATKRSDSDDCIPLKDLKIGDQVEIIGLNIEGILLEDPSCKKKVRVRVGDSEIKADSSLILGIRHGDGNRKETKVKAKVKELKPSTSTLDLRGKRGEESLGDISKFFDSALLNGITEVCLIHGHGTGRLKRAIREYLKESPYVLSYHPGNIYEGGDGVTVVELQ